MTVDLSNAKAGDIIKIVIDAYDVAGFGERDRRTRAFNYDQIIAIESPPFDVNKDCKPGMAFWFNRSPERPVEKVYFCFYDIDGRPLFSIQDQAYPQDLWSVNRAPEHDIKVRP